jgi:hypothetical protein
MLRPPFKPPPPGGVAPNSLRTTAIGHDLLLSAWTDRGLVCIVYAYIIILMIMSPTNDTRPQVREGTSHRQNRNCPTVTKILS